MTKTKLLIAGLMLILANTAMANVTMKDVETAVNVNHDYRQAEKLIGDLSTKNPGNARDHWVYAQILHHNGKDTQAVDELANAKRLDPNYSFVSDPHKVSVFESSLNPPARAVAVPSVQATTPPMLHQEPTVNRATVPQPVLAQAPDKSGHVFLWVVLIVALIGVICIILVHRAKATERREAEALMKAKRQEQLTLANKLLESVKPLKLDLRIANPPRVDLVSQVVDIERSLVSLIEKLAHAPVTQGEIDRISARLSQVRRDFEGKADISPPSSDMAYQRAALNQSNDNDAALVSNAARSPVYPSQQVLQSGYQPVMQPVYQQPVQQVIVENNSSDDGFVAGMVIGSLMSEHDHRDREVVREVTEIREVREVQEPVYMHDEPAQSDIDFGNDNTGDNYSDDSGSSGDIDFGSSDDDN